MQQTQMFEEKSKKPIFCNYFYKAPCIANWDIGSWNIVNYHYERPEQCAIHGCRNTQYAGNGDVGWFHDMGFVCAVHNYLIPRMSGDEIEELGVTYGRAWDIYHNNRYEVNMFPTVVYTSDGKRKEFIHPEGQKRMDKLREFQDPQRRKW